MNQLITCLIRSDALAMKYERYTFHVVKGHLSGYDRVHIVLQKGIFCMIKDALSQIFSQNLMISSDKSHFFKSFLSIF
jgi:hypothetical protein